MNLSVRTATEADARFIVDSWQKSYRTSDYAGICCLEDWPRIMWEQLHKVLAREGVQALVAHHPKADPRKKADIAGWLVVERGFSIPRKKPGKGMKLCKEPLIHYAYTKENYRREGVFTLLLKKAKIDPTLPVYVSCKTGVLSALPLERVEFNPRIVRFPRRNHVKSKEQ